MRERTVIPTAPKRDTWRSTEGLLDAATKTLRGKLTPVEFEAYARDIGMLPWLDSHKSKSRYSLQVKRFRPEHRRPRKDPVPLEQHTVFPHAPLLDHHRMLTWSSEQKQDRIQQAYNNYLSNRFTFHDFAREVRLFDGLSAPKHPEGMPSRIHHETVFLQQEGPTPPADASIPNKSVVVAVFNRLIAPLRSQ